MTNNIERLVVGIRHRAKNGNMQIEVFSFVTDFKTKDAITACEIIIKVILSLKTFFKHPKFNNNNPYYIYKFKGHVKAFLSNEVISDYQVIGKVPSCCTFYIPANLTWARVS